MSSKIERMVRTWDDPVLKQVCTAVEPGDKLDFVEKLVMVAKKYRSAAGVTAAGLAAPQIGIAKRVIVTNCRNTRGTVATRTMINPAIYARSLETEVAEEGCLSYPGKLKRVRRHAWIEVSWLTLERRPMSQKFSGFEARVIQHEVDHLDGVCRVGDDSPDDVDVIDESAPFTADDAKALSGEPNVKVIRRLSTSAIHRTAILAAVLAAGIGGKGRHS